MDQKNIKKIVLAYSGGLDTSIHHPLAEGTLQQPRDHRRIR